MIRVRFLHILQEMAPFVLVSAAVQFEIELLTLGATIGAIVLTFRHGYRRNEFVLFLVGIALGLAIEIGLSSISRQQYWKNASFFDVPLWLPVMWGYGFVVIRRVGDLIIGRNH